MVDIFFVLDWTTLKLHRFSNLEAPIYLFGRDAYL